VHGGEAIPFAPDSPLRVTALVLDGLPGGVASGDLLFADLRAGERAAPGGVAAAGQQPAAAGQPVAGEAEAAPTVATAPSPEATPAPAIPDNQAEIVFHNDFAEAPIRLTIDQQFRVEPGSSFFTIAPGEEVAVRVWSGRIEMSASATTSRRNLEGNDQIAVSGGESRYVNVTFAPDGDQWRLLLWP
jgi:hypothetical protein